MPNSDTWPRAVSVETLSNMDSARSCDSVISVNSACSEDSMEHLSAEEKACLMYLEETIESLDLQEDSGFSNDEPESGIRRIKHGGPEAAAPPDVSSNILTVLAESRGSFSETENPTSQSSQTSSSSTPDISDPDLPSHIPPDPTPAPPESASGSTTPVPEPSLPSVNNEPSAKSEMDLSVIPPPSDFMDEPVSPPNQRDTGNSSPISPAKPTINLEVLRRRVSEKNMSGSALSASVNPTPLAPTSVSPTPASPAPMEPASVSPAPTSPTPMEPTTVSPAPPENPTPAAEPPLTPPPAAPSVATEPKSPPAVAPKPKKLPPNIILKSHKSAGGHDGIMGHPSPTDRLLMDPQKVRMEALRKLGLLKSEDSDSGPAVNPKSLQTRKSWAPSTSSPLSPPPPKSAPPSAPHFTASVPNSIQAPAHFPSDPLPDIIPVPAAFSDPVARSHDDVFHVSNRGSPDLDKKLQSSPGGGGVKSATLERSGLGLSSYLESMDKQQTLGQLRNSRPRPASLGSGKDFVGEKRVPAPSTHPDNSQKLPRSQGISVIISPGEQSEESRREALRKLGLLRD